MYAGPDRAPHAVSRTIIVSAYLLLAGCAASSSGSGWVKAGADQAMTARQAGDCRARANAALASEHGINEDISATLGGNWQLGHTTSVVDQSMAEPGRRLCQTGVRQLHAEKGFKKAD